MLYLQVRGFMYHCLFLFALLKRAKFFFSFFNVSVFSVFYGSVKEFRSIAGHKLKREAALLLPYKVLDNKKR